MLSLASFSKVLLLDNWIRQNYFGNLSATKNRKDNHLGTKIHHMNFFEHRALLVEAFATIAHRYSH